MYLLFMILLAIFMTQYQLKQRKLHLEIYSYKKYDFRYRKATQSGLPNTNANRGKYDTLPKDGGPQDEEDSGDDEA